jgi:hypothetical protein
MMIACAAEVKTEVDNGIEHTNHWVAKIRLDEFKPSIAQNATDALMYEGFHTSWPISRYKSATVLRSKLKNKGSSIHASVFNLEFSKQATQRILC